MAVVSKSTILGYLGSTTEEVLSQISNILESHFHKTEGKIIKTLTEDSGVITINFSDDTTKALYSKEELDAIIAPILNNQVSGFIARRNRADLPATGNTDTAYFVLDDTTDENNNGTWGWDGSGYYQGTKLPIVNTTDKPTLTDEGLFSGGKIVEMVDEKTAKTTQYKGVASLTTDPESVNGSWLAKETGEYTNFLENATTPIKIKAEETCFIKKAEGDTYYTKEVIKTDRLSNSSRAINQLLKSFYPDINFLGYVDSTYTESPSLNKAFMSLEAGTVLGVSGVEIGDFLIGNNVIFQKINLSNLLETRIDENVEGKINTFKSDRLTYRGKITSLSFNPNGKTGSWLAEETGEYTNFLENATTPIKIKAEETCFIKKSEGDTYYTKEIIKTDRVSNTSRAINQLLKSFYPDINFLGYVDSTYTESPSLNKAFMSLEAGTVLGVSGVEIGDFLIGNNVIFQKINLSNLLETRIDENVEGKINTFKSDRLTYRGKITSLSFNPNGKTGVWFADLVGEYTNMPVNASLNLTIKAGEICFIKKSESGTYFVKEIIFTQQASFNSTVFSQFLKVYKPDARFLGFADTTNTDNPTVNNTFMAVVDGTVLGKTVSSGDFLVGTGAEFEVVNPEVIAKQKELASKSPRIQNIYAKRKVVSGNYETFDRIQAKAISFPTNEVLTDYRGEYVRNGFTDWLNFDATADLVYKERTLQVCKQGAGKVLSVYSDDSLETWQEVESDTVFSNHSFMPTMWGIGYDPKNGVLVSTTRVYSLGDNQLTCLLWSLDFGKTWEYAIDNLHARSIMQISDYTLMSGAVITLGSDTFTEGVDWFAFNSNLDTLKSLRNAICNHSNWNCRMDADNLKLVIKTRTVGTTGNGIATSGTGSGYSFENTTTINGTNYATEADYFNACAIPLFNGDNVALGSSDMVNCCVLMNSILCKDGKFEFYAHYYNGTDSTTPIYVSRFDVDSVKNVTSAIVDYDLIYSFNQLQWVEPVATYDAILNRIFVGLRSQSLNDMTYLYSDDDGATWNGLNQIDGFKAKQGNTFIHRLPDPFNFEDTHFLTMGDVQINHKEIYLIGTLTRYTDGVAVRTCKVEDFPNFSDVQYLNTDKADRIDKLGYYFNNAGFNSVSSSCYAPFARKLVVFFDEPVADAVIGVKHRLAIATFSF